VLSAQVTSSQDQNTDFTPLVPRLTRYEVGMGPEVAAAAVQALADLFAEMERRGKLLATLPGSPPATSRKLANKPALGLHPLICVISECHELFGQLTYGAPAAKLAISVIKQGRKFGITLILDTQSPTAASIPTDVTRNVSCGSPSPWATMTPTTACWAPAGTGPEYGPPSCACTPTGVPVWRLGSATPPLN
jgi:hypothetical protein